MVQKMYIRPGKFRWNTLFVTVFMILIVGAVCLVMAGEGPGSLSAEKNRDDGATVKSHDTHVAPGTISPSDPGTISPSDGGTTAPTPGASTGGGYSSSGTQPGVTDTPTDQRPFQPPGPVDAANPPGADTVTFSWVPPGPQNPLDPDSDGRFLGWAEQKRCSDLSTYTSGSALWGALGAVCSALFEGNASGWTKAASLLSTLTQPPPNDDDDCLRYAAYVLVNNLVTYHQKHPTAHIIAVDGTGTACRLLFTGFGMPWSEHGAEWCLPLNGGSAQLRLGGRLIDPVVVIFGNQRIAVPEALDYKGTPQPNTYMFTPPAVSDPKTVQVHVESGGRPVPGAATITYGSSGENGKCKTSTSSASPSANPPSTPSTPSARQASPSPVKRPSP